MSSIREVTFHTRQMGCEPLAVPIPEAARMIGCGRSKLYELLNAKEIPLLKLGRKSVVPVAALRAFVIAKTKVA